MKKLLLAVLISGAALNAMAADTADLTVKGKLTNSACTPSFSGGGVVDYGSIYLGGLSATTNNQLGVKEFTFTISCAGPTVVGWTNTDNRASSRAFNVSVDHATATDITASSSGNLFGLGMAGNVPLGMASIYVDIPNIKLDGNSKDMIYTDLPFAAAPTWIHTDTGVSAPSIRAFALANTGTLIPVAGTVYTIPYKVSAAIQNTATLAITDKAPLDGNATFTVIYL